jgi:hypothetical protein
MSRSHIFTRRALLRCTRLQKKKKVTKDAGDAPGDALQEAAGASSSGGEGATAGTGKPAGDQGGKEADKR